MATVKFKHSQELLQAYLSMNFYSLCLFFFGHWLTNPQIWQLGLVPACMLVLSWSFFHGRQMITLETHDLEVSLFVLAQAMGHLWCAHLFRDLGGYFLFLTHGLVGMLLFYFQEAHVHDGRMPKGVVPLIAGVLLTVGLQGKYPILGVNHLPSMLSFVLLSFGLVVWGANITHRYVRNTMRGYRKKLTRSASMVDEEEKVRHFFHDVINQTHNILLFLEHERSSSAHMDEQDMILVQKEVLVLQSLVQEHFGITHRHGNPQSNWIPFVEMSEQLKRMATNYLVGPKYHWTFEFGGELALELPESKRQHVYVHAPYVYRIFNNMVKNVAESGCDDIVFSFQCEFGELKITSRNKIMRLCDARDDLSKILERAILDSSETSSDDATNQVAGVGLESMAQLCESLGGNFSFSLEGDYWTTRVTLPVRSGFEVNIDEDDTRSRAA